jgi:predicted TIM-barrel fold metal-dependent hydrolase
MATAKSSKRKPKHKKTIQEDNINPNSSQDYTPDLGKKDPQHGRKKTGFYRKLNAILLILILVSAAVLAVRFLDVFETDSNGNGNGNGNGETYNYTVASIIPSRDAGIINCHEHVQDIGQAPKWTEAMDRVGVSTTIILGSPDATYILKPSGRFNKYDENNEELMKMVDKYPDRFIAFPTIYTYDNNKLSKLKSFIDRGAVGLKLFSGHYASFHDVLGPLNHSTMFPVYEYLEKNSIPIIWHVHLGIEDIYNEFVDVLARYPNLIITIPHFGLSSIKISRLEYFLDTYPNLYTDISFGYWAKAGLWRLSNYSAFYGEKLIKYQDRFQFGTDMVCTEHPRKTVEWIANLTQGYKDILEKEYFNLTVKEDIEGDFNGEYPSQFNGTNLPQDVIDKIYYDNVVKFLCGKNYTHKLSDVLNETKLKVEGRDTRSSSENIDEDSLNLSPERYLILTVTKPSF